MTKVKDALAKTRTLPPQTQVEIGRGFTTCKRKPKEAFSEGEKSSNRHGLRT